MVKGLAWEGCHSSKRGDVEDDTTATILGLSHHSSGLHSHADRSEKIRLELRVHLLLCRSLRVACQLVAGIVDEHINMEGFSKVVHRSFESLLDRSWGCDVKSQLEDGVAVCEVRQAVRVSSYRDQTMSRLAGDQFCDGATDATGAPSNYEWLLA